MSPTDICTRLAQLELLDDLLPDDQRAERQRIYDEIAPGYSDPAEQAYRVFEIVSAGAEGLAASVADQRLAQCEILLNAGTYATVGRMPVGEIRDARSWAPNWAWSRTLMAMELERPRDADEMARLAERLAPQLLRAGADSLVNFYGQIGSRAGWLMRLRSRMSSPGSDKSSHVATLKLIKERRREFSKGPRADGHYLRRTPLKTPDLPLTPAGWLTVRLLRSTVRTSASSHPAGIPW